MLKTKKQKTEQNIQRLWTKYKRCNMNNGTSDKERKNKEKKT